MLICIYEAAVEDAGLKLTIHMTGSEMTLVITNPRRDFTARGFTESYDLHVPSDVASQPASLASCDISEDLIEIQALEAPAPTRICDDKIGGFVLCALALDLYVRVFTTTGSERSADMMVVSLRCEDALVRYYNKFGFTFVQKEPDWGLTSSEMRISLADLLTHCGGVYGMRECKNRSRPRRRG